MDVIIFGGQSNMQGQTEALPFPNEAVENCHEYRLTTDEILPLRHPVGEEILAGLLSGSDQGRGSMVPAFCRAYSAASGKKVLAVHAAKGSTTIAEWLRGTQKYYYTVLKAKTAIQKVQQTEEVENIYYVWLQGESDALIQTTEEEYFQRLIAYKNDLKKDLGITKFALIKVGYFASEAVWLKQDKTVRTTWDENVMRAQERAVSVDSDFVMLTRVCPTISRDAAFINPEACGHYNNAAQELIGMQAGKALAEL